MATYAWMAKMRKPQKFSTRFRNRCQICGRPRAYYRDFGLCRICLRNMAHEGLIPGLKKSSW
ncbi:MAG: type Z 30S ribosomal protein S14, partial [Elusimicrobia bacterium]|nr:type Z 30S ribosomal protein S14 [Elusimicrobiota bacterium]